MGNSFLNWSEGFSSRKPILLHIKSTVQKQTTCVQLLPHVFSLITLENPFYCCEFLLYYLVYRDFSFLLSELATQLTRISHIWIREDGLLALVQPNIFHLKSIQLCFKLPKEKKKYGESNKHKAIALFIAVQTWKPLKCLIMG